MRATDDTDPDDLGGDLEALAAPLDAEVENGAADRAWVDLQLDVITGAVVGLLGIAVVIALVGHREHARPLGARACAASTPCCAPSA